jgi:hypothetical protein
MRKCDDEIYQLASGLHDDDIDDSFIMGSFIT